ncbi:MAG: GGDEF domain-containing protein, partial [Chloroflexota bacterium]|nr:GGDEF domain-containing protein [Chloroflexota bacterium]
MASSTEIEVVDASIRTLQRLFEPTGGAIFTRDEQGAWIIQRGWGSEQLSVEKGEHPCLPMYTTDGQVAAHSDNLHICVPLATARGSLGFVSLSFASDDHVASPRRLLLENVCKYIALAISNQRLYTLARVQSVTDALTGLHNYRYLEEFLDQEWTRRKRTGAPLSLLMLDGDHFKFINDRYGHDIGDRVLRAIATALKSHVRSSDLVTRYGGEEFVVVLPNTDAAGAAQLAEKLRRIVSEITLPEVDEALRVTASIGVANVPEHADSIETLRKQADAALYSAKSQRNRVCVAERRPTDRPEERPHRYTRAST